MLNRNEVNWDGYADLCEAAIWITGDRSKPAGDLLEVFLPRIRFWIRLGAFTVQEALFWLSRALQRRRVPDADNRVRLALGLPAVERPKIVVRPATDDEARVTKALARISPDDRETWLRVGAALKGAFGERGRGIWDAWAKVSEKFSDKEQARAWKSLKGGCGLGTIFHLSGRGNARVD